MLKPPLVCFARDGGIKRFRGRELQSPEKASEGS